MPLGQWAYRSYYRVRRRVVRHYDRVLKWIRSLGGNGMRGKKKEMSDEMKPLKPEISASAVAALIGMNPYRKPHEVMYSVLQKNKALKETIRRLETQHRRVPIEVMQRNLANDNEIRKILSDGLEATKTNTDIRGIVENAASQIGVVGALR